MMSRSNIDLAHIKVLMVKLYDFFEDQEISITPEDFNFEVNDDGFRVFLVKSMYPSS